MSSHKTLELWIVTSSFGNFAHARKAVARKKWTENAFDIKQA